MGWTPPHLNGIDVPDWDLVFPVNSEKESEMKISRVGVDLAKNVFQVYAVDRYGRQVWRRRLRRSTWLKVIGDDGQGSTSNDRRRPCGLKLPSGPRVPIDRRVDWVKALTV